MKKTHRLKKDKRKFALLWAFVFVFAISGSISVYAYFSSGSGKDISGSVKNGTVDTQVITKEISSFEELLSYAGGTNGYTIAPSSSATESGYKGNFNDDRKETVSTERLILKLTADIKLKTDVTFRTDSHIDLNGKTLVLNGKDLIFYHTYHGNIVIKNGNVITGAIASGNDAASTAFGKFIFDAPYAYPSFYSVTAYHDATEENGVIKFSDDKKITDTSYYSVIAANDVMIGYHALRIATAKLANYADLVPEELSYDDLSKLTVTNDLFAANLFISEKKCYTTSDPAETEPCFYVFGDLDFATHILAYNGLTVEYSFVKASASGTGNISALGKVTLPAENSGAESGTLTVTVKKDGKTIAVTELKAHLVNPANASSFVAAGKTMINALIDRFYTDYTAEGAITKKHVFKREVQFPAMLSLPNGTLSFDYRVYGGENQNTDYTTSDTIVTENGIVKFIPTEAVTKMIVTISTTINSVTESVELAIKDIVATDAGLVRTEASLAQDFILNNYGGKITLRAEYDSGGNLTGFSDQIIYSLKNGNADGSIKGIKYELVNDINSLYALTVPEGDSNGKLSVEDFKTNNPLDYVQSVQLNCTFSFAGEKEVTLQIPIEAVANDSGDNVNGFLPYYNYYNQMFYAQTGLYTINSFEMPFAYSNDGKIVCYDILSRGASGNLIWNDVKGISVSLYYNGKDHSLTPQAEIGGSYPYSSYVNALKSHVADGVTEAGMKSYQKILSYGDARWKFNIDPSKIGSKDVDFEIVYNYVMSLNDGFQAYSKIVQNGESTTTTYITTAFTLPGVLLLDETKTSPDAVYDKYLYIWMYEAFGGVAYDNSTDAKNYVLVDWLKQNRDLDVTDDNTLVSASSKALLEKVNNFKGIEYMTGTSYVNLSGIDLSGDYANTMTYLSQMSSITTLYLCNCNLSAKINAANPNDADLEKLAALKRLTELHIENSVGNTTNINKVYSMEFLTSFANLNRVYVYGNLANSTGDTPVGVGGVFYGSVGLVNMEYFAELSSSGTSVYNTASTSAQFLFEEQTGVNDYKILQSVEYQKKLKNGIPIKAVYESFAKTTSNMLPTQKSAVAAFYGLETSYKVGASSYPVTVNSLVWGSDDGDNDTETTEFYVAYTFTLNDTTVTIKVKFNVVRVD